MKILITGASQGIGFDVAVKLSQNPNNQIIAVSRNENALQQLAKSALHGNIKTITADITALQKDENAPIRAQLLDLCNPLDVLINNAGMLVSNSFQSTPDSDWLDMYQLHVVAPANLSGMLMHLMGTQGTHAHIVNISSMGGFQGSKKFPGLAAYSASKAALACLTECMAEELKAHENRISVNCLALGAAQTEMLNKAFPGYKAPLSSEEMAEFVANFAMTGQQYFNGKILPVSVDTP